MLLSISLIIPMPRRKTFSTFVQGPDFPTGGIVFCKEDIHQAYRTGRGGVVCRGEAEITESKQGMTHIIITSIPVPR